MQKQGVFSYKESTIMAFYSYWRDKHLIIFSMLLAIIPLGCQNGQSLAEHLSQAQQAIAQNEWRTATIELKNVLSQQPDHVQARLLLGQVFVRTGNLVGAEQELTRAQKLGAQPTDLQPWLAQAWLKQGNTSAVLDLDLTPFTSASLKAQLLALQAQALISTQKNEEAQQKVDESLQLDAQCAEAMRAQAMLYSQQQQPQQALAMLEQAVATNPNDGQSWQMMGVLQRNQNNLDAAEQAFTKAMEAPSELIGAQLNRLFTRIDREHWDAAQADLESLRKLFKKGSVPQLDYAAGLLAYRQNQYPEAIQSFMNALSANPDFIPVYFFRGVSYLAVDKATLAAADLQRFSAAQPEDITAKRLLALALFKSGDISAAEQAARAVLERNENDAAMLEILSDILLAQGKADESVSYLRKVKAIVPESAAVNARLGVALMRQGDAEAGLKELEQALTQEPTLQGVAEQLIIGHVQAGELDRALSDAQALQQRNPESAAAQALLGAVYMARQEPEQAQSAFAQALKLEPGHLAATNGLAMIALRAGDGAKALGYLQQALEHQPDQMQLLISAARLAWDQGQSDTAQAYLKQAVTAHPEALAPAIYLAEFQLRAGNSDGAWETIQAVSNRYPKNGALLGLSTEISLARKDYDEALKALDVLEATASNDPKIAYARARAYAGLGKTQLLREELNRALSLQPDFIPALLALTRQAIADKDAAQALQYMATLKKQQAEVERAELLLLEGQIAQLQGNTTQADKAIAGLLDNDGTAIDLDTNNPYWNAAEQLVLGYVRNGDIKAAIKAAEELNQHQKDSSRVQALLGALYLRAENMDAAQKAFLTTLELEPGHIIASEGLAVLALKNGDTDQAQRYYQESLAVHPDNVVLLAGLARLALAGQDEEAARQYLEQAVTKNPDSLKAKLLFGEFLLTQKQAQEALTLLTPELTAQPDQVGLLFLVGRASLAAGDYQQARQVLQHAHDLRPQATPVISALAEAQFKLGDFAAARDSLMQALADNPDSEQTHIALARLSLTEHNVDAARAQLEALRQLPDASKKELLFIEGQIAELEEQWDKAIQSYEAINALEPGTANVLLIAKAFVQAQRFDDAERAVLDWLESHPEDSLAHFSLAQFYMQQQRSQDAIAQFKLAHETSPENVIILNNLAWMLKDQDPKQALDYARQAYDKAPDSLAIKDTLSMVLLAAGNVKEAHQLNNQLLKAEPNNGTFLYHSAQILQADQNKLAAIHALREALNRSQGNGFEERSQAEALLKELEAGNQ
jgi:putative PEP-CTERM system TPR-repeat lipoprotein